MLPILALLLQMHGCKTRCMNCMKLTCCSCVALSIFMPIATRSFRVGNVYPLASPLPLLCNNNNKNHNCCTNLLFRYGVDKLSSLCLSAIQNNPIQNGHESEDLTLLQPVTSCKREVSRLHCQKYRDVYAVGTGTSTLLSRCMEECWAATSWNMNPRDEENPEEVNRIWRRLVSPVPQSYFVLRRAVAMATADDPTNVESRRTEILYCCRHLLKDSFSLVVARQKQRPDVNGTNKLTTPQPGTNWDVLSPLELVQDEDRYWETIFTAPPSKNDYTSIATLARQILELEEDNNYNNNDGGDTRAKLLDQVNARFFLTLGSDIRGRSAVDAALCLALAGVSDHDLFNRLYQVLRLELDRVKCRRAPNVLLHIVEKVAASGALASADNNNDVARLQALIAAALPRMPQNMIQASESAAAISIQHQPASQPLPPISSSALQSLDLLHPRSLIWLWRYSSRLTKPIVSTEQAHLVPHWTPTFTDNTKPLILDLGCGLGVTLLGLACRNDIIPEYLHNQCQDSTICWSDCNFLGCDANPRTTRFASGMAKRWQHRIGNNDKQLEYCTISTSNLLSDVENNYPGPVLLILLQFPTPYRLIGDDSSDENGNMQLPDSPKSPSFMASPMVLSEIAHLMQSKRCRLLLQSNCEDVALTIVQQAGSCGLHTVHALEPVTNEPKITERTARWLANAQDNKPFRRAVGDIWWSNSLLPCPSETEAACVLQQNPVHRCLFEVGRN